MAPSKHPGRQMEDISDIGLQAGGKPNHGEATPPEVNAVRLSPEPNVEQATKLLVGSPRRPRHWLDGLATVCPLVNRQARRFIKG